MRVTILIIALSLFGVASFAQDKKEKAKEEGRRAIKLADEGKFDEAIAILTECHKIDPGTMDYMYEIGYCHYHKEDYAKAVKCFTEVIHHKDANDRCYQMLGNAYDIMGDSINALKTYKEGLTRFPDAGRLYLETGNYHLVKKDYNNALVNYERGIAKDPMHSSNYFRASQIFLTMTEEEVWGMIYGEIFINLEPNTERTQAMSKWLHDTYRQAVVWESDTSMSVSFTKMGNYVNVDNFDSTKKFKMPFSAFAYEGIIGAVAAVFKNMDLEAMCKMREEYIKVFFEQGFYIDYPVALFDYNYKIMKSGHADAYNHWLLSQGDKEGFKKWKASHQAELDKFAEWYKENKLDLNPKNAFVRSDFGG